MNRRTEVALYAVSALLLAGTAGIWWQGIRPSPAPPSASLQPVGVVQEAGGAAQSGPKVATPIFVHIAGAVRKPGVYQFKEGQRLFEALDLVELSEDADVSALNLASLLRDSQKVYVPAVGEDEPPSAVDAGTTYPADPSGEAAVTFPINVNTASQRQLEELPGVGPVLAGAIIARRKEFGSFQRPEDLQDVPGIGEKTFARIAPFVTVK